MPVAVSSRQHLTDNFADLPTVGDGLLNGHVLFVYTENEHLISRAIMAIAHLSPHGVSMYDIKKLCKTLDKYRQQSWRLLHSHLTTEMLLPQHPARLSHHHRSNLNIQPG